MIVDDLYNQCRMFDSSNQKQQQMYMNDANGKIIVQLNHHWQQKKITVPSRKKSDIHVYIEECTNKKKQQNPN